MKALQLLDCTMREAPVEQLMFGSSFIHRFVTGLERANIDIIELGFLKDADYVEGSTIFNRVEQMEDYLQEKKENIMYVALVDYGRYQLEQLSPYNGKSIDGIRICFKKGEQYEALEYARKIKKLGYEVCIQHVDTLAYSEEEIVEIIELVNQLKPFAYSIVDTFGSMYTDDLNRLFRLVHGHLNPEIILGFHSHNNLMLAAANCQEFIRLVTGKRRGIVDASVLGCGRGAGNAHTELLVEFMNKKYEGTYDLNEVLDMIDTCIPKIEEKASWGYSIPYFISGMHSSHVFNVNHLLKRHNISSRDLREIIEMLDVKKKKEYDYALLERLYIQHFNRYVEDSNALKHLHDVMKDRTVLLLAPGSSVMREKRKIMGVIEQQRPIIISINNRIPGYTLDYIFFSSIKRYDEFQLEGEDEKVPRIITSNIKENGEQGEYVVNYLSLIKTGWVNLDNAAILSLRLLRRLSVGKIYIAGLDGYVPGSASNFFDSRLTLGVKETELDLINREITSMLIDFKNEAESEKMQLKFLTKGLFTHIFGGNEDEEGSFI